MRTIERLIAALEAGKSEALKNYLAVMSRFHRYSWGNCLMIYFQRPDASQVAGFHAWLKLNRHVRKGEKGSLIVYANTFTRTEENAEGQEIERETISMCPGSDRPGPISAHTGYRCCRIRVQ